MKRFHEYFSQTDQEFPVTIYSDHNLADHMDKLRLILMRYDVRDCEFDSIRKNQVSPKELPGLAFGDVYVIKAVLGVEPRSAEVLFKDIAANFQPGWKISVDVGGGRNAKNASKAKVQAFTGTVPGSLDVEDDTDYSKSLYGRNRIEDAMREAEARAKAKAAKKTEVKFLTAHDTLSEMGIPKRKGVYLCSHDGERVTVLEMIDADFDRGEIAFAASVPEIQALAPEIPDTTFDQFDLPMSADDTLFATLGCLGLECDESGIESDGDRVMVPLVCGATVDLTKLMKLAVEAPEWHVEIQAVTGGSTDNGAGCLALIFTHSASAAQEIEVTIPSLDNWDEHVPSDAVIPTF